MSAIAVRSRGIHLTFMDCMPSEGGIRLTFMDCRPSEGGIHLTFMECMAMHMGGIFT